MILAYIIGFHRTTQYTVTPEYNHSLKKVVVSLSVANHDLSFGDSLLAALPDYTEIIMLLPDENVQEITAELQNKTYFQQIKLVPFETKEVTNPAFVCINLYENDIDYFQVQGKSILPGGTPWAQDLFKALINKDGELKFLFPPIYKCLLDNNGNYTFDNSYINNLSSTGIYIERTPFEFTGGNVLTGKIQGEKIGFVGTDLLRDNDSLRKILPKSIPGDRKIKKMIHDKFGVDEVIFIGDKKERQPDTLFHLDQAMIFLDDGEVGVSHIVGEYPENKEDYELVIHAELFLFELRNKLLSLGFHVHDIDMTVQNLLHYEEYVNAIPYTDVNTDQKTLLMPIFDSYYEGDEDEKIIEKNISIFESVGYEVIKVKAQSTEHQGGIHCLVNVFE